MSKIKIGLICLLSAIIWVGCEKEKVDVKGDSEISKQWNFSTDEFVSWPSLYDQHIADNSTAKSGGQQLRAATEDEADIVNQVFAADDMQALVVQISDEIGIPDWSMLMAFKHGSAREIFELFVPLYDNQQLEGILTITNHDEDIVVRAVKRNSLDHLMVDNIDREVVIFQIPTVAAFNIFDKLEHNGTTPMYESWYDEVFSEGFDKSSDYNAKCYAYTRTYWTTTRTSSVTVTYKEVTLTSYVDCGIPDEPQDPFGTNSEVVVVPIDLRETETSSAAPLKKDVNTYVDLSPFKPVLDEYIVDNTTTPCVQNIIAKIKDSNFGQDLFVDVLRDIFDVNADINIEIIEKKLPLAQDAGHSITDSQSSSLYNVERLNAVISLNSEFTNSATEDWILASIIHEMIHAYIAYNRNRLAGGFITQSEFDKQFPLWANSPKIEHEIMANKYIGTISDILMANNPKLNSNEALALAHAGFGETDYWKNSLSQPQRDAARDQTLVGRGSKEDNTSTQIKCQ